MTCSRKASANPFAEYLASTMQSVEQNRRVCDTERPQIGQLSFVGLFCFLLDVMPFDCFL
jgi:hypothetical protein